MKATNHTNLKHKWHLRLLFKAIVALFFIYSNNLSAQEPLKPLNPAEYGIWSETFIRNISPNGKWVSYQLMYESKNDTLHVKSLTSEKDYSIPGNNQCYFLGNLFVAQNKETLTLQDLENGQRRQITGVTGFRYSADQNYLVVAKKTDTKLKNLTIENLQGRKIWEEHNIESFELSDTGHQIVYSSLIGNKLNIVLLDMSTPSKSIKIIENSTGNVSDFVWTNNTIAFVLKEKDTVNLFSYDVSKHLLKKCPFQSSTPALSKMNIAVRQYQNMIITDDGNKIIFRISEPTQKENEDQKIVEIWNTKDKRFPDRKKVMGSYTTIDKIAVWDVENGKVKQITDIENPSLFFNGNYSHAFVYNPSAYEPHTQMHGPVDLYSVNLSTGEKWEVARKMAADYLPFPSPDGRFLSFFHNGQLWLYDILNKNHTSLMTEHSALLFNHESSMPNDVSPWGIAGWSHDSRYLLIYDEYDVWQINIKTKASNRITQGREKQQLFRIGKPLFDMKPKILPLRNPPPVNLEKGLILAVKNVTQGLSGFYLWENKKGLKEIVWQEKKVTEIARTSLGQFVYLEQRYDSSPTIMLTQKEGVKKVVMKSNPQHQKYQWGKASLVQYEYLGKKLSGILYSPPQYKKGQKFPMIVYIYQKQSQYLHNYISPSIHTSDGFNIPHLLAQGYFILLPDITYTFGALAESVTGSVVAAVDTVVAKGDIDNSKLGLIGHSFGGYESYLIATQTNRFATVVAGNGWTDLVSASLYLGPTLSIPDLYRAEYDQLRIGKSLFEDMNAYLNNSPVLLAQKVSTPVLGWVGKEDRHVNAWQGHEFYFALRRLRKDGVFLQYNDEGHNLNSNKSQEDLTLRIQQWFDRYLENGPIKDWMIQTKD